MNGLPADRDHVAESPIYASCDWSTVPPSRLAVTQEAAFACGDPRVEQDDGNDCESKQPVYASAIFHNLRDLTSLRKRLIVKTIAGVSSTVRVRW